ncbi:hypothetical protein MLD38_029996 [Melastoma candidum]|uniref:Uncharacterized protein n=1 Tax=Melastoma candidum TaxID=119954 RepID=A0ACB9MLU8_9MYRT|nr:hypothetical protein MLD38_029996 [Melastoma candidum]
MIMATSQSTSSSSSSSYPSSLFANPNLTTQLLFLWLLLSGLSPVAPQKVTVSLYYETLCPYCATFIVDSLSKLFRDNLISIVNLRLIPWGNGIVQSDGSMVCQHGPDECLLNAIEACTISIFPDTVRQFNFVYCVEWLMLRGRHGEWSRCLQSTGLGNAPIDCYNRGYGNQLERRNADETAGLNPRHRFVPWVIVDNHPLQEDFPNFVSYICKAYRGNQQPAACRALSAGDFRYSDIKVDHSVCYTSGNAPNVTSTLQ